MTTLRKLHVLLVVAELPQPVIGGVTLRNWQHVNTIAERAQVGVFGLRSSGAPAPSIDGLVRWDASGDPGLHEAVAKMAASTEWMRRADGHPSDAFYTDTVAEELRALVVDLEPGVAVVTQLWLHRFVPLLQDLGCRVVVDMHNVEAPLARQIAIQATDPRQRMFHTMLAERVEQLEGRTLAMADELWACSDLDAREAANCYGLATTPTVVPNTIEVGRYRRLPGEGESQGEGPVMLLAGTLAYPPNEAGAIELVNEILPEVQRTYPAARVVIVGSHATQKLLDAVAGNEAVTLAGEVPDVVPYLHAADVLVVPLRAGSGTRFKLLEAFAAELPVVSTAKGAEGLDVVDGVHLRLGETASELAAAVADLYGNQSGARLLTDAALSLVAERYSWAAATKIVSEALDRLSASD